MTPNEWHAWSFHDDSSAIATASAVPNDGVLILPFDPRYLIQDDDLCIYGAGDSCVVKPIQSKEGKMAAECVEFPDIDCPVCNEPGHSINDSNCKNPVVSIRSEFIGCRKCYDEKYTGLANRYLYDMCRLMGLDFPWLD